MLHQLCMFLSMELTMVPVTYQPDGSMEGDAADNL